MTGNYARERLSRDNCRQNAWWMVAMYPELTYVEGYLVFTDPDGTGRRIEHAWNQAPGGRSWTPPHGVRRGGTLPL
jgi:hypothetical protein